MMRETGEMEGIAASKDAGKCVEHARGRGYRVEVAIFVSQRMRVTDDEYA